ncbi:uncharacterized protein ABDE67_007579 [Symphorus nematophorus]
MFYKITPPVTDCAGKLDVSSSFSRAGIEGEDITYGCLDTVYRSQKFLCKNECNKAEDILIETEENRAQNGRFSIEYIKGSTFGLHVTITQATKSDSGWYKCGYGRALSPDSAYTNLVLVIAAATTSNTNWSPRPSTSVPSASTQTTTQSFSSTSGGFTPSSAFPETNDKITGVSRVLQTGYIFPLIVCVPLVVLLLVVALRLPSTWKKKRFTADSRNMEFPVILKNWTPLFTCEDSTSKTSRD